MVDLTRGPVELAVGLTRSSKPGSNSKKEHDGGDGSIAVVINRNDGTGLFTVPELVPFDAGSIRETETGDFNGDGVADLVVAGPTGVSGYDSNP